MNSALWKLENVTLSGAPRPRLQDITLAIHSGVTAVIGYSGAGKTSLLNLLVAMERPTAGSITKSYARQPNTLPLYWVAQDGGLWPHCTAKQHIEAVLNANSAANSGNQADSPDKILNQFGLLQRQHAFPAELSMGERSRLSVARALAANPTVLVMDEPLAHVDPVRTPEYWNVIRNHIHANNTSLIFSTHEPEAAISQSDHTICLQEGKILYSGHTMNLYQNPGTEEAGRFLGPLNWFTANEATKWLATETTQNSFRPEALQLVTDSNGPLQVVATCFRGSYTETTIQHISSSHERIIVHRSAVNHHAVGAIVRLETVS